MSEPSGDGVGAAEDAVQPTNSADGGPADPKTFSPEYVAKLRDEAAANRVARASAEERMDHAIEQLYRSCLELGTAGILRDPSDLPGEPDDFRGEDGMPSLDKIRDAALRLVDEKPYLATPRVPTASLQGPTGSQAEQVGLGTLLRQAAA